MAAAAQAATGFGGGALRTRCADVLRKAARLAEENIDTLVEWLVRESGSTSP